MGSSWSLSVLRPPSAFLAETKVHRACYTDSQSTSVLRLSFLGKRLACVLRSKNSITASQESFPLWFPMRYLPIGVIAKLANIPHPTYLYPLKSEKQSPFLLNSNCWGRGGPSYVTPSLFNSCNKHTLTSTPNCTFRRPPFERDGHLSFPPSQMQPSIPPPS